MSTGGCLCSDLQSRSKSRAVLGGGGSFTATFGARAAITAERSTRFALPGLAASPPAPAPAPTADGDDDDDGDAAAAVDGEAAAAAGREAPVAAVVGDDAAAAVVARGTAALDGLDAAAAAGCFVSAWLASTRSRSVTSSSATRALSGSIRSTFCSSQHTTCTALKQRHASQRCGAGPQECGDSTAMHGRHSPAAG
jgi:hypothetical protein